MDIEGISRRNSTTPVSSSEDGGSSQTDEYDCLSWAGDCPGDPGNQSHSSRIVDASSCQDHPSIVPHQGYPAPCGNVSNVELKQDG